MEHSEAVTRPSKRQAVHEKFGGRCAYCGHPVEIKKMQIDHIVAKFRFGTDDLANLHPACASCNNWKHSFTVEEFRKELESQPDRLRKYHASFRIGERFGLVAQAASKVTFYFERQPAQPHPPTGASHEQ